MLTTTATSTATPVIRPAAAEHRAGALVLIREFLAHMHEFGSEIIPTDRTVGFFADLLDSYVDGRVEGVALLAFQGDAIVGISMAGHAMPFDTVYGKTATGWLTYVRPATRGHGTGTHLRAALRDALRSQGYTAIAAGYHTWNEGSRRFVEQRGFRSLQIYGIETLDSDSGLGLEAP